MDADKEAVKTSEQTDAQPEVKEQVADTTEKEQTFSQSELNRIVTERVAREKSKFEKKYANVDVTHYKTLVENEDSRRQEELEKRGEFDKVLKEQADKFNSKIQQYETELTGIKVDGSLLGEASTQKAINPQQVVKLLKGSVKLNEGGTVDVVDTNGQVRYDDKGHPIKVSTLVKEFLTANPHFVNSGPSGTGTGQGTGKQENVVENDITKLNMNNPADREQYRKIMLGRGIRV